jgi:predicted dehydrogenase
MNVNTLATELSLFFSRELTQKTGEDLVEKQNAELGLMPVVTDETASYGYVDENRHMVAAFLRGERPRENFDDGVNVTELLMAAYMSAERDAAVDFASAPLDGFVPQVARGVWNPRK